MLGAALLHSSSSCVMVHNMIQTWSDCAASSSRAYVMLQNVMLQHVIDMVLIVLHQAAALTRN